MTVRRTLPLVLSSLVVSQIILAQSSLPEHPRSSGVQGQPPWVVPVVVVKYFPVVGEDIDIAVTGDWGKSLAFTRSKTDSLTQCLVDSLREASRFRRYKNLHAEPSLTYKIVKTFEFLEKLPTLTKPGDAVPMTDYAEIMKRIDGRNWVDKGGVKEIWLWGYHGGKVGLWESNMAGPFGDVSNSDRDTADLPLYGNTYTLYHYNYQRGLSEAVEDHMHQIEALLNYVDGRDTLPESKWGSLLFWGKFVGYFPGGNWAQAAQDIPKDRRCGWAHFTPNSEKDYDWKNTQYVWTDIEDWKPDGSGEKKRMNCEQWGCNSLRWFMYWMQSLPGKDNGLTDDGRPLTNWWMFVGDFDGAMQRTPSLSVRAPFLSSLSVTKDDPLYTTYAAALERSEFVLDEGYHLVFYDSSRGVDLTTDMAGDLCVAFKKGEKYVYDVGDMYKAPVISLSYGDMVRYRYYPFEDVKVEATFLVHSSRLALLDLAIHNTGSQRITLHTFPFLHNTYRIFENIGLLKEKNAITFTHEELPDDWVLEHKVPYVDKVQNLLLFSQPVSRLTSFRSYKWGNVQIPQEVNISKKRVYVVWGRVTNKKGARCTGDPADARLMVVLNSDRQRILTESAPCWGRTAGNFNRYSLYGVELGNFEGLKEGDQYRVVLQCPGSDQLASVSGVVRDLKDTSDVRIDAILQDPPSPAAPEGLKKDIWGSGTEIRLYWKRSPEPVTYNVYRRDYRSSGAYALLAEGLSRTFYTDKNITGDKIYGYVVVAIDAQGRMSMHSGEVNNIAGSDFLTDVRYPGQIMNDVRDHVRIVATHFQFDLASGESVPLRIVRAVARTDEDRQRVLLQAQSLLGEDLSKHIEADEKLYSAIPLVKFAGSDKTLLYWSAFMQMRQVMLPPEGKCGVNYYVFSREPQWGWGHGGQVFHESLTMLAYAQMDPLSAMNSQRVYMERQYKDGYINYRTGPYLDENIPHKNQLTTSAPWYAWQNWEVYKISKDKKFLENAYTSSAAFYNYYVRNRDSDEDGLCEWGGDAMLESVRDALVAVWDQVDSASNFEAVDLNCMLVEEAKSLSAMAEELGYAGEAQTWREDAAKRSNLINQTMWDEQTGFYYCVDKKTHSFTYKKPDDLKRQEIIGFLPLWAGVADRQRAGRLLEALRDTSKFWRRFGVPSLSADDPYYNPKGYWNGPVWVQWNYLVVRGLLDYGFVAEARDLTERVTANMVAQLKKDHNFWEFYSPDDQWAGYHKTYIWAGIINRMVLDVMAAGGK